VVTGAARGIGAAIAGRFACQGWETLLVDVNPEVHDTAAGMSEKAGARVTACVADLTAAPGREAVELAVAGLEDRLTALVNNAGITRDAMLHKMGTEQFRAVIAVNLGAAYELTDLLADQIAEGGSVISVSSKSAMGNIGQFNYAVSKSALIGMTRSLALALAPRVRVNAIAPAFIATEMSAAIPDQLREQIVARIPFGRPGSPGEVADLAHWLASPQSSYVTGQVISICGGRSFG
jgi:NAD(P)-dependent dehydrogenase (short-subunit alcohol dehydrogenase family)